jgi:hypothetical protein
MEEEEIQVQQPATLRLQKMAILAEKYQQDMMLKQKRRKGVGMIISSLCHVKISKASPTWIISGALGF